MKKFLIPYLTASLFSISFFAPSLVSAEDSVSGKITQEVSDDTDMEPQNPVSRIQFDTGKSSQQISGGIVRGTSNEYLLGVRQGQTISVSVTSVEDNAVFNIMEPGKESSAVGSEDNYELKNWSGVTKKSGDYVIVVGSTRGGADFKMNVSVK